jgi:uncharacterized coiled-coil protein SlyX
MSKTHVIDGVTYMEVGRMANAGEKVVCGGSISTVKFTDGNYYIVEFDGSYNGRDAWYVTDCRALEPLEYPTPDVSDLLANLARRVASLETQLSATQGNVEKLAEELANTKHLTESNEKDIAMLDERTQPTEEPVTPDESIPQYWAEALIRFYGGNR